jgi:hypothetical protein
VVALFLFQIGTGFFFVWRQTVAPGDRFRAFQIASGVYFAFYLLGQMDSVFIFARTYLGIDTGRSFATGVPTVLVKDPWNIRSCHIIGSACSSFSRISGVGRVRSSWRMGPARHSPTD